MKQYIILSFFVIFTTSSIQAQEINGKWMKIPIPNSISYPKINILEIENDSISAYNFNKLYEKNKIVIRNNTFHLNDTITVGFSFINENMFELKSPNHKQDMGVSYRYVRLLPTIDENKLVNSLENTSYSISFAYEKLRFKLGERKDKDDVNIINDPPIASDYSNIETFGDTYFLCFHLLDRISYAFPIREIYSDSLILYGIPKVEGELIARRVN